MQRMPGMWSSAATKRISDVPGLVKQVSTPQANRVCTRLSAPFIPAPIPVWARTLRGTRRAGNALPGGPTRPTEAANAEERPTEDDHDHVPRAHVRGRLGGAADLRARGQ